MTFEERVPSIVHEIEKRRHKWTLNRISYEDVSQIILLHIFNKYNQFDESKGQFTHWLNRIISCQFKNILRDNLTKWSRPCILGCKFCLGGDSCGYTASRVQCEECPIFARWKEKKLSHFNVMQSLPLENHSQEVNNMQCDFIEIEQFKGVIDKKIKSHLNIFEYKVYTMLYISHLNPEEVGAQVGWKKAKNSDIPGYQQLLKIKKKIIVAAKEIIKEELYG